MIWTVLYMHQYMTILPYCRAALKDKACFVDDASKMHKNRPKIQSS